MFVLGILVFFVALPFVLRNIVEQATRGRQD
jgi:hypothetical protein